MLNRKTFWWICLLLCGFAACASEPEGKVPALTTTHTATPTTVPTTVPSSTTDDFLPAFPGAEGFGARSVGGRGGQVFAVTNLNDKGEGSLRAAVEVAGPRIVHFRVAGVIKLKSPIEINEPYITIAGQTAPGDGITLRNTGSNDEPPIRINTHDVVIRYLRSRPGPSDDESANLDALQIAGGYNIIIDHSSFSWATDEVISTWQDPHDITIQWSILAEGLNDSTHLEGPHSKGLLIGSFGVDRLSLHHNLLAHNEERNPRIQGGFTDLVNNVIYNAGGQYVARIDDEWSVTAARCNYVGNYHKPGLDSEWLYELKLSSLSDAGISCFVADNFGPNRLHSAIPNEMIVAPDGRQYVTDERHAAPAVTTHSAHEAFGLVLSEAGATLPQRDAVDARIVRDVIYGTGRFIDDPDDVGGWPEMEQATPPRDSDEDGMPDAWENRYQLDPQNSADNADDLDGDGYTNIEEYLNKTQPDVAD